MKELESSKIQRSGASVDYWNNEDSKILGGINDGFRFVSSIASKGGGRTDICLSIALEDMRPLLIEAAERYPELADSLAEATHRAIQGLKRSK